jgi:hypothetical protein
VNLSTGVDSAVEWPLSATGQYSREHGGLHEELPLAFWETSGLDAIVQLDESAECKKDSSLGSGARHQPERRRQQEEHRQQNNEERKQPSRDYSRREAARKRVGGRRWSRTAADARAWMPERTITTTRSGLPPTTSSLSAHSEHSSRSDTGKSHILQRMPPR